MSAERVNQLFRLSNQGIDGLGRVFYNLNESELLSEAVNRKEGELGIGDVLLVNTGENRLIQKYIKTDEKFEIFINMLMDLINFFMSVFESEGKSYFILSFGCTGGQHRSVFITDFVAETLAKKNIQVSKRHLELERTKRNIQPT